VEECVYVCIDMYTNQVDKRNKSMYIK